MFKKITSNTLLSVALLFSAIPVDAMWSRLPKGKILNPRIFLPMAAVTGGLAYAGNSTSYAQGNQLDAELAKQNQSIQNLEIKVAAIEQHLMTPPKPNPFASFFVPQRTEPLKDADKDRLYMDILNDFFINSPEQIEIFMTCLKECQKNNPYPISLNRMLFSGEPGIGKTELIKDIARALQIEYLVVKPGSFYDSQAGNIELKAQALIDLIKSRPIINPLIILFDELDAATASRLNPKNGEVTRAVTAALCSVLSETKDIRQVCIVGATNHREHLDDAIISRLNEGVIDLEKITKEEDFIRFFTKDLLKAGFTDPVEIRATAKCIFTYVDKKSKARKFLKKSVLTGFDGYPGRDLGSIVKKAFGYRCTEANSRLSGFNRQAMLDEKSIQKAVDDMDKSYGLQLWNKRINGIKLFSSEWGTTIGVAVVLAPIVVVGAYYGLDKLGFFKSAKTAGTTVALAKDLIPATVQAPSKVVFASGVATGVAGTLLAGTAVYLAINTSEEPKAILENKI